MVKIHRSDILTWKIIAFYSKAKIKYQNFIINEGWGKKYVGDDFKSVVSFFEQKRIKIGSSNNQKTEINIPIIKVLISIESYLRNTTMKNKLVAVW